MTETQTRAGFGTITPYLIVEGVAALLDYLGAVFDAEVILSLPRDDGTVMHAEIEIGDSKVMMGEPTAEFGVMPASLYIYVPDCDAIFRRAVDAGGEPVMEPTDMTHAGQRYGGVKDPSGNLWWIATHLEDVSSEEELRRLRGA